MTVEPQQIQSLRKSYVTFKSLGMLEKHLETYMNIDEKGTDAGPANEVIEEIRQILWQTFLVILSFTNIVELFDLDK